MNSEPVVVKLINGDVFMAYLINSTDETLIVQDPVSVKTVHIPTEGCVIEKVITQPFCALTLDREYVFDMRMVLYVKNLNPKIAKHFERIVGSFEEEKMEEEDFGPMFFEEDSESEEYEEEPILIIPDKHQLH